MSDQSIFLKVRYTTQQMCSRGKATSKSVVGSPTLGTVQRNYNHDNSKSLTKKRLQHLLISKHHESQLHPALPKYKQCFSLQS